MSWSDRPSSRPSGIIDCSRLCKRAILERGTVWLPPKGGRSVTLVCDSFWIIPVTLVPSVNSA